MMEQEAPQSEHTVQRPAVEQEQQPHALQQFLGEKALSVLQQKQISKFEDNHIHIYGAIRQKRCIIAQDTNEHLENLSVGLIIARFRMEGVFASDDRVLRWIVVVPKQQHVKEKVKLIEQFRQFDNEYKVQGVFGKDLNMNVAINIYKGVNILVSTAIMLGHFNYSFKQGMDQFLFGKVEIMSICGGDKILLPVQQKHIHSVLSDITKIGRKDIQLLQFSNQLPRWGRQLLQVCQNTGTLSIDIQPLTYSSPTNITHYLIKQSSISSTFILDLNASFTIEYGRTVVFCRDKTSVIKLSEDLGQICGSIHSDLSQEDRNAVIADFKAYRIYIIVTMDTFADQLPIHLVKLYIQHLADTKKKLIERLQIMKSHTLSTNIFYYWDSGSFFDQKMKILNEVCTINPLSSGIPKKNCEIWFKQ